MADKKGLVLQETHKALDNLLQSKAAALPKDFNETRFLQNCMTVLQDVKGIEECQPVSVARTMLKGAFLGLDFFNKECYAIIYNRKVGNTWIKSLEFQTDYKGEIKLAKKYSINPIKEIYAKIVREGDDFEEKIVNGQQVINFDPKSFNDGKILGAFAVCYFEDGSMTYETMSVGEIENIKNEFSKKDKEGKFSKAWEGSAKGEMYKKTVLRRLCKLVELDFDTIVQKKTYNESSDFAFKEESKKEISTFDDAVETNYTDISTDAEPPKEGESNDIKQE